MKFATIRILQHIESYKVYLYKVLKQVGLRHMHCRLVSHADMLKLFASKLAMPKDRCHSETLDLGRSGAAAYPAYAYREQNSLTRVEYQYNGGDAHSAH